MDFQSDKAEPKGLGWNEHRLTRCIEQVILHTYAKDPAVELYTRSLLLTCHCWGCDNSPDAALVLVKLDGYNSS